MSYTFVREGEPVPEHGWSVGATHTGGTMILRDGEIVAEALGCPAEGEEPWKLAEQIVVRMNGFA